ncbi:MAG TPA: Sec-independent protein translocase subunit TatA [Dermatophilaceae bacterium]|jgi:sec-independent protein translocase protein TatA|nr:Sec-independent protein translocase subunit TatA [Dermatophilaceae bacterium]
MNLFKPEHLIVLVVLLGLLFGWKKLPDAARSLGRSMRIFKSEVEEMKKDGKETPSAASTDTVKGETVRPNDDVKPDPNWAPTAKSPERETHNQPPA